MGNVIKYQTRVLLCLFVALVFATEISREHSLICGIYVDRISLELKYIRNGLDSRLPHVSCQQPSLQTRGGWAAVTWLFLTMRPAVCSRTAVGNRANLKGNVDLKIVKSTPFKSLNQQQIFSIQVSSYLKRGHL